MGFRMIYDMFPYFAGAILIGGFIFGVICFSNSTVNYTYRPNIPDNPIPSNNLVTVSITEPKIGTFRVIPYQEDKFRVEEYVRRIVKYEDEYRKSEYSGNKIFSRTVPVYGNVWETVGKYTEDCDNAIPINFENEWEAEQFIMKQLSFIKAEEDRKERIRIHAEQHPPREVPPYKDYSI